MEKHFVEIEADAHVEKFRASEFEREVSELEKNLLEIEAIMGGTMPELRRRLEILKQDPEWYANAIWY